MCSEYYHLPLQSVEVIYHRPPYSGGFREIANSEDVQAKIDGYKKPRLTIDGCGLLLNPRPLFRADESPHAGCVHGFRPIRTIIICDTVFAFVDFQQSFHL
jgi:hypothetical protein